MEWNVRQIIEMLGSIRDSDYDEVNVEAKNLRLHVRRVIVPAGNPHDELLQGPPAAVPAPATRAAD